MSWVSSKEKTVSDHKRSGYSLLCLSFNEDKGGRDETFSTESLSQSLARWDSGQCNQNDREQSQLKKNK